MYDRLRWFLSALNARKKILACHIIQFLYNYYSENKRLMFRLQRYSTA